MIQNNPGNGQVCPGLQVPMPREGHNYSQHFHNGRDQLCLKLSYIGWKVSNVVKNVAGS